MELGRLSPPACLAIPMSPRWRSFYFALTVTLIVLAIHFGTFGGVMAATFAGLLTSVATSLAKRAFGFLQGDLYFPGLIRLAL